MFQMLIKKNVAYQLMRIKNNDHLKITIFLGDVRVATIIIKNFLFYHELKGKALSYISISRLLALFG